MKAQVRFCSIVAVVVMLAGFVEIKVASAADATGTWKWTRTRQNGQTTESTLKAKQDGEKLTGTIKQGEREEVTIENGQVKNDEVSFTVSGERNGNKFTAKYKGKLSGDSIKGTTEMTFGDNQTRNVDWEAKRG